MNCANCQSLVELWMGGLKCPSCGGWWEIKQREEPGTVRDLCKIINWLELKTKAHPQIRVHLCPDANAYKMDIYPKWGDMPMDQRINLACNELEAYCQEIGIPLEDQYWFISTTNHNFDQ